MVTDSMSTSSNKECAVEMLNEAISLLTNSQYIIANLMTHSNLTGTTIGNEIRKLKRNITEFLNKAQG